MSFDKTFCPSPWFHMRINNSGGLEYCRWADRHVTPDTSTIENVSLQQYFQDSMSPIRNDLLNGNTVAGCHLCKNMEAHGKVSGRQMQMLKVGIDPDKFTNTTLSSTFYRHFKESFENGGNTDLLPQDWQIDLGNFCNSSCVFCRPLSSSRVANEWKKLNLITELPPNSWAEKESNIEKLVDLIAQSGTSDKYIHFLGGETLITPAFEKIIKSLIEKKLNDSITLGFTTNLTVWNDSIIDLLKQFKMINVGVSIETLNEVNDYVRWPSRIESVKQILQRWIDIKDQNGWIFSIRITPTVLTIHRIKDIFEYAYSRSLTVESCNFIDDPRFMRPSVLPVKERQPIIDSLKEWAASKGIDREIHYNIRHPDRTKIQLINDVNSYVNYLENMPDESEYFTELVSYLKKLESLRGNRVLDYLPEYEDLFRSFGY